MEVADMLRIVDVQKHPNEMYVTVEGESPDRVSSPEARKLAYDERLKHGFENAGVEALGGPYNSNHYAQNPTPNEDAIAPLETEERTNLAHTATAHGVALVYRQQFKIKRLLS
jgi:hypothetical protein